MLFPQSISSNIIPGIVKALEVYTLVYKQDEIMRRVSPQWAKQWMGINDSEMISIDGHLISEVEGTVPGGDFKIPGGEAGKKSQAQRDEENAEEFFRKQREFEQREKEHELRQKELKHRIEDLKQRQDEMKWQKAERASKDFEKEKAQIEKDLQRAEEQGRKEKSEILKIIQQREELELKKKESERKEAEWEAKGKGGTVDVSPISTGLTLEPTWVKMTIKTRDGGETTGLLGIKVIPYMVKSEADLAQLLLYDRQISKIESYILNKGRQVLKLLYKFWDRGIWRSKGSTVKGDVRHDIIMARTSFRDLYASINFSSLNDDFFKSAGRINRLYKMGWSSLIFLDDVNRRVMFCMKEFKGMCSITNYSFLYSSVGVGTHSRVFENMEEVKASASSIFKTQIKETKLLGESVAQNKLIDYKAGRI